MALPVWASAGTNQCRILGYALEIGWTYLPRGKAAALAIALSRR